MVERVLIDHTNPLENLSEDGVFNRYRFHTRTINFLCGLLAGRLEPESRRNQALPTLYTVLISLQFLASGTFQSIVGDTIRCHKSTASRSIRRFLVAMGGLRARFVVFPSVEEAATLKRRFFNVAGSFVNVICFMFCLFTHLFMLNPSLPCCFRSSVPAPPSLNWLSCRLQGLFTTVLKRWH